MTKQSDLSQIRENLKTWLAAFNDKDIEKLFSLYDAESVYANAGAPLMVGVEAVRPWYEGALAAATGFLHFIEEVAFQESDMGFVVGKYYFEPPTGSDEIGDTGRVCLIYRRNAEGEWKLLFDMDNTPPDVTPEDFA